MLQKLAMHRSSRLQVVLLLVLLLLPGLARAQNSAAAEEARQYRAAVRALDRSDSAVGYALSVRREGRLFVLGGSLIMGGAMLGAAVDLATTGDAATTAPLVVGVGIPVGLTVMVSGFPALVASNKFLRFYVAKGAPSSQLARLRLLRRWRLEILRLRRDTGLIASGFLGGAAVLMSVVWAVRDRAGFNDVGASYDPGDAVTAMSFIASSGASALTGLISHLIWAQEWHHPHRLYATVSGGIVPAGPRGEPGVHAGLTVVF